MYKEIEYSEAQKGNRQGDQAKRTYKDSIFRYLFNDQDKISELYSAISDSEVNSDSIEIVTLENAIFNGIKNDLSFTVDSKLIVMIEHQSTDNPNMPVRMLCYLGEQYRKILSDENWFGNSLIKIPTPELYVFYNGITKCEEEWAQKLSEAFEKQTGAPCVEVIVKIININYTSGLELLNKCKPLEDYSVLIHKIRMYQKDGGNLDHAVKRAIRECIEEGRLVEFLKQNGGEVMDILNFTLTEEQKKKIYKDEGREEARIEDARKFIAKGIPLDIIAKCTGLTMESLEAM